MVTISETTYALILMYIEWGHYTTIVKHISWFPQVFNAVNSSLSAAAGEVYSHLQPQLWEALDKEISLAECDIYR